MPSRITREGFTEVLALIIQGLRDGVALLHDERGFDQLDCQTDLEMPLDVTYQTKN